MQPLKPQREPWNIDAASFQALLAALDPDRASASAEYERIRRRLIRFFSIHQARSPEDLADMAFNRIARRIAEGEQIRNARQYLSGIARILLLEDGQKRRREEYVLRMAAKASDSYPDQDLPEALEACLAMLPAEARDLLARYYSADGRKRITLRQQMAEEMGIELNALRNRALRLRERLEECVEKRMGWKNST